MTNTPFFTLPDTNIQLRAKPADLSFFDKQTIELQHPISPLEAWGIAMSRSLTLLNTAFRIRDRISGLFGVKRIGGFTAARPKTVSIGEKLDFFLVEQATDDVLCLTERDKHLDVLTCVSVMGRSLSITSSVITHNAFGRAYMIPVRPAHKLIVRSFLKRIKAYSDETPKAA